MMALQGRFHRFYNVLGNFNKNLFGNTIRYNYPNCQPIAGIRQSADEKINIPPKPKRPLTPYFKFMSQIRPEIKREKPNISTIDIVREVAAKWEKVDPNYKEKLETEYKKEQEVYAKERLEYDTKLTEEQKNAIKQARIDRIEYKEKLKKRKKCKENNKPKKPTTAFVQFLKTKIPSRGSTDFKTFQKEVAKEWYELPDSKKQPFIDEMHRQSKEYQKQMVEWERKMIKMGNTDIVRQDALIEPSFKPKGKKKE